MSRSPASEHDTAAFRELMNRETKGTESVADENEWNGAEGLNRIGESIRKEAQLLPLPPLCTGVMPYMMSAPGGVQKIPDMKGIHIS